MTGTRVCGRRPLRKVDLLAAAMLSALFTIALLYLTLELPRAVNAWLRSAVPDPYSEAGLGEASRRVMEAMGVLRPTGYASLAATGVLIALGLLLRRGHLSALGSAALYLPTFGYFASTMFFLAGIGILRALWLPLLDLSPNVLRLGEVVYLPALPLVRLVGVTCPLVIMSLGLLVFTLGALTWLYSRFVGAEIADFWIYRYSRHPQYLGFLVWSYGLMPLAGLLLAPRGDYVPPPSLPWLLSALTIAGVALYEERAMLERYGDRHRRYVERTPFMIPLPRKLSAAIALPAKVVTGRERPESGAQILAALFTYFCMLVLLSLLHIIGR